MESASIRRAPPLPGLIQVGLIGLLFVLAAVAWIVTDNQMSGMDAGPGTDPGTLGFFLGVWVVMMAGMMFPSIAPMVTMHVRIQDARRAKGQSAPVGATTLFVAGYLITWAGAGLVGYCVYELGKAVTGDTFSWHNAGPELAGGIIVLAAIYQLTPLKDTCLRHCRSPFGFLMQHWRPGRTGALRVGLLHGAWCVGCCWALMAALFALGVMSIGWMAFIAALIAAEKLLPWPVATSRAIALLLLVLGLSVAITPSSVPGLTLPDSPEAMKAMSSMEGGSMNSTQSGSMDSKQSGSMDQGSMDSKHGGPMKSDSMDARQGKAMHDSSDGSMKAGMGEMK
jgi:predicted metal-binding membrane protein